MSHIARYHHFKCAACCLKCSPLIIVIGASSPCRPQGSPGRATQPSADKVPVRKMTKLDAVTTTTTEDQDSVLKNTDGATKIDVIDTSAAGI